MKPIATSAEIVGASHLVTVRVLQQWWIDEESEIDGTFEGEWRDIPVEEQA